jgi:DNA-binding transcriptional regulator YiaG
MEKTFPVSEVVAALIAHHAKRLTQDPELKQSAFADELDAEASNMSRWLAKKASPRGANLRDLIKSLQAVRALPTRRGAKHSRKTQIKGK